ncbi:hypothetical protein EDB81DRAFT_795779 [Dactylonectria macrodidyma]|uniref:DUF1446-domain-containing protein n=1 Tax=Dactylonectria macrodidyma TaxID=307937 RepID=A0A9P9J4B5_9HYPO|nr:hypothetical protein EDB81DRAFT_795779 [Dactylonectria macrodidyma]
MGESGLTKRSIRIGNCAGASGDGPDQMFRLVSEGPLDAITADYLAELNLAARAIEIQEQPSMGYERPALAHLKFRDTARLIAEKGVKLVHNGGGLNPQGLYKEVRDYFTSIGFPFIKIAWVDGDNVMPQIDELRKDPTSIRHLDIKDADIGSLQEDILCSNAYIGMQGIIQALNAGAQIVICGRVCDASPVMGLAAWWHGWKYDDYDQIAGGLVAGHLIECGCYVTGGNFCGFKSIEKPYLHGYPIAEISADGSCEITMHDGSNGAVTVDSVKAQLLYEIQGSEYLNPDVVAHLSNAVVSESGPNRIRCYGITGSPPPPTTKLALFAKGGFQAELSTFANGLDIKEKVDVLRLQTEKEIGDTVSRYTKIDITAYGSSPTDPQSQAECTVMIRNFVQAPTAELCVAFAKAHLKAAMGSYAGYYPLVDMRTFLNPKPYTVYFPGTILQSHLDIRVHMDDGPGQKVSPPPKMRPFMGQVSYDTANPTDLNSFGPTRKAPLGSIVLARSGDKGGNANVGFWVRHEDEYPWLQALLSISKFKELLARDYRPEYRIERCEMPNLQAVHFVTYGILQNGVSSSSVLDGLAKSFGEFLRAREVDVPIKFLERGWI